MFRHLFLFFLCVAGLGFCESPAKQAIVIENRVLATVRDQVITVQDVVKKLDMLFYQNFPEHRASTEARFEFYKATWRKMLEDLVNRQLVLSWAEERQFTVTNGDIRQELEDIFGPNVMMNLYESGFSLHEVQEMIRADILMRRLLYFQVRLPVLAAISPSRVRALYETKVQQHCCEEILHWRTVTLKAKDGDCPKRIADSVFSMLDKEHLSIPEVAKKVPDTIEVTASEQFCSEKKEVAPNIYDLLSKLQQGSYSEPISFVSKQNAQKGWRFYIVNSKEQVPISPLADTEGELRFELAQPEIEVKTKELFDELHKEYQVKQLISSQELSSLEPFYLAEKLM